MSADTTITSSLLGLTAAQGYTTVSDSGAFGVEPLSGSRGFGCITGGS